MSFEINVAGLGVPSGGVSFKSFRDELNLVFHLDAALSHLLDSRLDQVPAAACTSKISYASPAVTWNPGGGPVQFGLQCNAGGTLEIVPSGALVSYMDGLASPQVKDVGVPSGVVYVRTTLNLQISANAAATYSGGAYGVKASLDTTDSYAVTYCKAFAPGTTVANALAAALKGFVLPLHEATLAQMDSGDHLLHEFDGNLHLAFGAYVGLDKVLYAGQASVDVLKAFGSPLAKLKGGVSPEIKAGVNFSFSYQYATRFEALISREPGTARLHLFRSSKQVVGAGFKPGLSFDGNATGSITANTDTVRSSLVAAAGGKDSLAGAAVDRVVGAAGGEVKKYVGEVNDKLAAWFDRANGIQANLQAEIEVTRSRTILAAYTFDMSNPASAQMAAAWKAAVDGDLLRAMASGVVALDAGSGLESEYRRKTSFDVNLFHLWKFSTWSEYAANVQMVYAGNNVFHLQAQIGRTVQTETVGAMHSMDLYFAAEASQGVSGPVASPSVTMHLHLTARSDVKATGRIATMLSAMEAGPVADALARDMHAFATRSPQGTAQLHVAISPRAYARINCDPYLNGKPATTSTYNDALNWAAFAKAADDLDAWALRSLPVVSPQMLAYLKTFPAWECLNETTTGSDTPNRLHTGDRAQWPSGFPNTDEGSRTLIVYSMLAGQSFMNFCEAVQNLAKAQDVGAAGMTWDGLLGLISDAVKKDVNGDFLRPTALALVRLCASPATVVRGPAPGVIPADHFGVEMAL